MTGNHGGYDYWIVKLDSIGFLEWEKSLGGTGDEEPNSIEPTNDGGYIISGFSASSNGDVSGNHGVHDCWIVKLGWATGEQKNATTGFKLYPNPALSQLVISSDNQFSIEGIEVYDVLGRKFLNETFFQQEQDAPITLDVSDLPAGFYEVRVQCNQGIGSAKFVKE